LELDVVNIEYDIDLDPIVEHSLSDLSMRSLDEFSNLDCKCWSRDYFALRILSLQFVEVLQSNILCGEVHYKFHK
jgi:hypothetical protein